MWLNGRIMRDAQVIFLRFFLLFHHNFMIFFFSFRECTILFISASQLIWTEIPDVYTSLFLRKRIT